MYFKKILSFLICTALLLSAAAYPLSANDLSVIRTEEFKVPTVKAEGSGTCGGNLKWAITWDTEVTLTISGTGPMDDYSSPSKTPWYASRNTIVKVVIENGVTSIGDYAFYGLAKMKSIQMPSSVRSIGEWAFAHCDKLSAIALGSKVESVGEYAFYSCDSLESVTVDNGNENYSCDYYSVLFNKDKTVLVYYPMGAFRSSYTVPDSVEKISSYAFANTKYLKTLTIGSGVKELGENVFYEAYSIENITVSEENISFASDEYGVLFDCEKTVLIQYPAGNARTSYTVPSGVLLIGESSFAGCEALESLTIPYGVEDIEQNAFVSCVNLAEVNLPATIKMVGYDAFMDTPYVNDMSYAVDCGAYYEIYAGNVLLYIIDAGITSGSYPVTINDKTTAIAFGAFEYSYASEVVIPSGIKYIGDGAFAYCSTLLTVNIPDTVNVLGEKVFEYCMNLNEVTLGKNVSFVGYNSFYGCESLDAIYVDGENTSYKNDDFGALISYDGKEFVQYPVGRDDVSYTVADGVMIIYGCAFNGAVNLESVALPESLMYVAPAAFDFCYNLTDVYYGGNENSWADVMILEDNEALLNANMTYGKENPKVCEIAVVSLPRTEYLFGETLSLDGIIVYAIYNDGNKVEITDYSVSGMNSYALGVQEITIFYGEFQTSFNVTVYAEKASGFTERFEAGMTVAEFKEAHSSYTTYVFDFDGVTPVDGDALIKTGYTVIVVEENTITENCLMIVIGDGNGDGIVNGKDLIRLKKQIKNGDEVAYIEYVDYNGDGVLDDSDASFLTDMI